MYAEVVRKRIAIGCCQTAIKGSAHWCGIHLAKIGRDDYNKNIRGIDTLVLDNPKKHGPSMQFELVRNDITNMHVDAASRGNASLRVPDMEFPPKVRRYIHA